MYNVSLQYFLVRTTSHCIGSNPLIHSFFGFRKNRKKRNILFLQFSLCIIYWKPVFRSAKLQNCSQKTELYQNVTTPISRNMYTPLVFIIFVKFNINNVFHVIIYKYFKIIIPELTNFQILFSIWLLYLLGVKSWAFYSSLGALISFVHKFSKQELYGFWLNK